MKIVQIVTQMEGGGAQRVAYLLHKAFQQRDHLCELWFLYLKRPAYPAGDDIRLLCEHKPKAFDYVRIAGRLQGWIEQSRPDAIISHTHYANILGASMALLRGVRRRIAVQHNPVQTYPGISQKADWLCGSLGVYTKQVAVSDSVVDSMTHYPRRYQEQVCRIYNGIAFHEERSDDEILARLPVGGPRILHVGRFSAQKNHDALLDVIAALPEAHLILVGDGERKAEIAARVSSMKLQQRVTFLGEVSPSQVRSVMRACDLFLFPSIYEAMPMALLEAMASGLPIVASDIPANRELLDGTGIVVGPKREEIVAASRRLLNDRVRSRELAGKAAERAAQFTVAAMADAYESILRN